MLNNIEIGERIRGIRKELNIDREKFSEMIDISDVFLGQIERGERSLSIKTLYKIVDFSASSSDYILFGNKNDNVIYNKISKILNRCSDNELNYIYNIIKYSYSFLKLMIKTTKIK